MPPRKPPAPPQPSGEQLVKVESSSTQEQATAGASQDAASTPTATPTASPAPSTGPPRAPLQSLARGGKPVAGPRAPKFVGRRSQTARQELEQAEAKKKADEQAAKAAEEKKKAKEARKFGYGGRGDRGGRGGRGGRGRGGHMGDDRRRGGDAVPSGPFSAGQASSEGRRSGWGSGGGGASGVFGSGMASGGGGGGGSRFSGGGGGSSGSGRSHGGGSSGAVKMEPGMGGGIPVIKPEDGGYISSDDDEVDASGPKQDIDQLQVIDLTAEEDERFAPVRLWREEHKTRTVGLSVEEELANAEDESNENATSEKKKGKQRAKDLEVTGAKEKPRRPTAYSSSDTDGEPYIKEEPVDDDSTRPTTPDPVVAPAESTLTSPQSSPESRRKAKERIKSTAEATNGDDDDDFALPDPPKFQTQAEKDEWERHYDDLRDIRNELGRLMPKAMTDADGDATMSDDTANLQRIKAQQKTREEHVYLFQFPPVLPDLKAVKVKPDPDTIRVAHPDDPQPMDVDEPEPAAKDAAKDKGQTAGQSKLPAGAVGKLRVHKSGKTTLDWGGTSLVLGMGAEATFLQNIMIARMPEKKPMDDDQAESDEQEPAVGMGMGQIRSKFIVTPDWEEILK